MTVHGSEMGVARRVTSAELARLDQLRPVARPWFVGLHQAMLARGYDMFVGQVHREPRQQRQAQADGTTSAAQDISWHELDLAVDWRRRLPDGTEDLTTSGPEDFWRALSEESAKIPGMRNLAYRPDGSKRLLNGKTWDPGHCEYRAGYVTLADAVKALAPELLA